MPRPDISDKLIHFTSGATVAEAFERLRTILAERRLVGCGAKIKGGFRCVCFTEAPLTSLKNGLVNPTAYSRYSPFGIVVEKGWVFSKGGRPVIYHSDGEFEALPENLRWRHMRYEPGVVDFTWEREWRLRTEELDFAPHEAGIVVPDGEWVEQLVHEHEAAQDLEIKAYSLIMDQALAEQNRDDFPWRVYVLK